MGYDYIEWLIMLSRIYDDIDVIAGLGSCNNMFMTFYNMFILSQMNLGYLTDSRYNILTSW